MLLLLLLLVSLHVEAVDESLSDSHVSNSISKTPCSWSGDVVVDVVVVVADVAHLQKKYGESRCTTGKSDHAKVFSSSDMGEGALMTMGEDDSL